MPRCPTCRKWLPEDRDRTGARCPVCREPIYERTAPPRLFTEPHEGQCVTHPTNAAAGTCQRCGNFYCAVCRSRWRRQLFCLACLERVLETREASPQERRAHYLQALWSLLFGIAAWALMLAGVVLIALAFWAGPEHPGVAAVLPGLLFTALAPAFAVPGLGLGATAIRSRGDHMILATIGLILSALMAGAIIGFLCLTAWRN